MRKTYSLLQVSLALLDEPTAKHWGYELSKKSGVRTGVLYPILHRMLDEGWLSDGWEDPREIVESRPPRRFYKLTPSGRREIRELLDVASLDPRFERLFDPHREQDI